VTAGLPIGVYEKQYRKVCKQLTHKQIHRVYEHIFEQSLENTLSKLSKLGASSWSNACVTAVLDASVFKHLMSGEDASGYHDSWFSGQNGCVVSGFKVHTIGIVIDGIFHPLAYDFERPLKNKNLESAQKGAQKARSFWKKQTLKLSKWHQKSAEHHQKTPLAKRNAFEIKKKAQQTVLETAVQDAFADLEKARQQVKAFAKEADSQDLAAVVACRLLNQLSVFWQKSRKRNPNLPEKLFLSVDNGYNKLEILQCCTKNSLTLLCVPKKNELFKIAEQEQSLQKWIESNYLEREIADSDASKDNHPVSKPFSWRVKAEYIAKGIKVTLLFFRLNRSDKVSVIYCPDTHDPTIFAKTMRHHWFCRTQIEQFFRMVKHILKIQEAKTQFFFEMDLKIGRFFWIALDAQYFTKQIRKACKKLRKVGFKQLIKHFIFNVNPLEILADFESFDFSLK
jgi:hypothetical protein